MKILRIRLVIVLVVLAGRTFNADAQSLTNIYSFGSYPNDGQEPFAGLVQGSDGNFYGTTLEGGGAANSDPLGTVFRISPSGSYTSLYKFVGSFVGGTFNENDGANPQGGLVQGSDGNFYGTTMYGGANSGGIVFKLTVPLNPAANQISGIQLVGTDVILSIPSIAGETYQLQCTTDLTSGIWSDVPGMSVTGSIGGVLTFTNCGGASQPQGFFQFHITR